MCEKNFAAALSEPIVSETPTEGQIGLHNVLLSSALVRRFFPLPTLPFPLSFILLCEFRRAVIFADFFKAQHQELSRIHASRVEMSFFIRSAKLIRARPPELCRIEFALEIDFAYKVTTQGTLAQTGMR